MVVRMSIAKVNTVKQMILDKNDLTRIGVSFRMNNLRYSLIGDSKTKTYVR